MTHSTKQNDVRITLHNLESNPMSYPNKQVRLTKRKLVGNHCISRTPNMTSLHFTCLAIIFAFSQLHVDFSFSQSKCMRPNRSHLQNVRPLLLLIPR